MNVRLNLPYFPWQGAWDTVRADPAMGPHLDAMVGALEAAGPPAERLKALTRSAGAARAAFAASGSRNPRPIDALAYVETDLRVAFFHDLAEAIAGSPAPTHDKLQALRELRALVDADPPIGVPEPHPNRPWSGTARQTAQVAVEAAMERLGP